MNDNKLILRGAISNVKDVCTYNIKGRNIDIISFDILVSRLSENKDLLPVLTTKETFSKIMVQDNGSYKVEGSLRSRNFIGEDGRSHTSIYIFATNIEEIESDYLVEECNQITISGTICKEPRFRETKSFRVITDIFVAIHRPSRPGRPIQSDYLPVISWGKLAMEAKNYRVGDKLEVKGRVQSRKFTKDNEEKTVYEISATDLTILEEEDA